MLLRSRLAQRWRLVGRSASIGGGLWQRDGHGGAVPLEKSPKLELDVSQVVSVRRVDANAGMLGLANTGLAPPLAVVQPLYLRYEYSKRLVSAQPVPECPVRSHGGREGRGRYRQTIGTTGLSSALAGRDERSLFRNL